MARIIDLVDIVAALAGEDMLAVSDISANMDKKLSAAQLSAFILLGKTIGGSGVGDITLNNATQTLSNKRLDSPRINSADVSSVTSADLNKLNLVTVSAVELNRLSGVSSNVQTQLAGKVSATSIYKMAKRYVQTILATDSSIIIPETTIRAGLGLGSDRRISENISVQVHNVTTNPGSVVGSLSALQILRGSEGALDKVTLTNTTVGNSYMFFMTCYDIGLGGGS
ncbi:MAG: hypothetical protein Q8M98_07840 [Candidatus Cloacimonadaceae bacterium]|nr:hypothetical protein [Candidatus Cloacimonadaceae bacterium]